MRGDQRGIHIQDDPLRRRAAFPRTHTCFSTSLPQRFETSCPQPFDDPPGRGIGGRTSEQIWMLTQCAKVTEAVTTVDQHHREVAENRAGVMLRLPGKDIPQLPRERTGKSHSIGDLVRQHAASMAGQTLAIGADLGSTWADTLHLQGALVQGDSGV